MQTLSFPNPSTRTSPAGFSGSFNANNQGSSGSGRVTVIVRGDVSEVQASVSAGTENARRVNGGEVLSTHIIARPHENLEYVLPMRYTESVEQFR